MNKRSVLIRIPQEDFFQIQKVARELNLTMASAYKVWKNKNLGWKNL
jgi:hypothetical protein